MTAPFDVVLSLLAFAIVALASRQIARALTRAHLPLITGFLLTGIAAGPWALGLIQSSVLPQLRFLDEIALGFIAFAAGAELNVRELGNRYRTIGWVTAGLVVSTFTLVSLTVFLIADAIPFMREMPSVVRLAVALLAGAVMVARSPSSAIAVVNEMRASGPFTRMVLGVTVIMDVVVIVLFAVNSAIADALVTRLSFDLMLTFLVVGEIAVSIGLGFLLGRALPQIASRRGHPWFKAALLLAVGFGVFLLSGAIRELTHREWPFEVLLEPLLICMVAGFTVTNFTDFRSDFGRILDTAGPPVYVVFFTLAGASLGLDVVAATWPIALLLFTVRATAIFIGSFAGGTAAGDPMRLNRIGWMSFITQAGIGLGLAKEVAVEFPTWGEAFASTIISVIVLNQVVGPPLFKWALQLSGEARLRAGRRDLKGTPTALIFGLEGQSLALARQLDGHGWRVKVATRKRELANGAPPGDVEIVRAPEFNVESLREMGADEAEAFVSLLSDDESRRICELAYEHFGTRTVIVRSADREFWDRYRELGATIVDTGVAMVSLLDHFVRSPTATALLLGMERSQDVADFEVRNPDLDGKALRDLRLPLDTLVLSVSRNGATLISHGYTRLELGDRVSVVGSQTSLDEVSTKLSG